jgi:hypothetical protein
MEDLDKVLRLMRKIDADNNIGIPQELAMKVVVKTAREDEWFATLVHETVSMTGDESGKSLLRLLYLLGVGTVITGRMN